MGTYYGMSETAAKFLADKIPTSGLVLSGKKEVLGSKDLILREFEVRTWVKDASGEGWVGHTFIETIQAKPWFKDGHIFTHLTSLDDGTIIGEWTDEEMATIIGMANGNTKTGEVAGSTPGPP